MQPYKVFSFPPSLPFSRNCMKWYKRPVLLVYSQHKCSPFSCCSLGPALLARLGPWQLPASIIVLLVLFLCRCVSLPVGVICFGNSCSHRFDVRHGIFFGVAGQGKGDVVFHCPPCFGPGCVTEYPSLARASLHGQLS